MFIASGRGHTALPTSSDLSRTTSASACFALASDASALRKKEEDVVMTSSTRRIRGTDFLGMQADQRLPVRPLQVCVAAICDGADPCLRLANGFTDLGLRHAQALYCRDKSFPVHAGIIRILFRNVNSNLIPFWRGLFFFAFQSEIC